MVRHGVRYENVCFCADGVREKKEHPCDTEEFFNHRDLSDMI